MIHIRAITNVKEFVSPRAYRQSMTEAHEAMALEWHRKQLPEHFKPDAPKKYHHKQRSPRYLKWKRRKWESRRPMRNGKYVKLGGIIDNVLSGDMKEMLTRGSTVRAFPTRVTVTMTGPRYMTMRVFEGNRAAARKAGWRYGKGKSFSSNAGQQPDKTKEVTATTLAERDHLAKVAERVSERKAAGWTTKQARGF